MMAMPVVGNRPDPGALVPAHHSVRAALGAILDAASVMRGGGWVEGADHLMRSHAHLQVWTLRGGIFDQLEAPDPKEVP